MSDRDELLKQIHALSGRMLGAAEGGVWEEVTELDKERQKLIDRCFSDQQPFAEDNRADRLIQKILDINQEMIDLGSEARKSLGDRMNKLQRGRSATEAYRRVDR